MRKIKSMMLAAIMLFTPNVSAKELETIVINGKDYVLPKYSTFLDPLTPNDDFTEELIMYANLVPYFISKVNGKSIVLPVYNDIEEYISPKDPNYQNADEELKENYIFLEEKFSYLEDFKEIPTRSSYNVVREFRSREYIGVLIGGTFLLTKDFFPEGYCADSSMIIDNDTFKKFSSNTNPNYEIASMPYENRWITFKEYKDYYTGVVLERNWPVTVTLSKNENNTIPKFGEEELSKDVEGLSLTRVLYTNDNKTYEEKTFITTELQTETDFQIFDYFTGQFIANMIKDVYNVEYLNQFGIKEQNLYVNMACRYPSFGLDESIRTQRNGLIGMSFGPEYCPYFEEVRTIGDAIEVYQLLPIEMQANYSKFDFSNDPRIEKLK